MKETLSSAETLAAAEQAALIKTKLGTRKTLVLAALAGAYIAMGGTLSLLVGYGFAQAAAGNPVCKSCSRAPVSAPADSGRSGPERRLFTAQRRPVPERSAAGIRGKPSHATGRSSISAISPARCCSPTFSST